MSRVAIVGAGLSGLVVARSLSEIAEVTVFEKGRGAGGRIATRYAGEFEFDHGAQFFTARTATFRKFLQPLLEDGIIADWPANFAQLDRNRITELRSWGDSYPHFVGTPRMNRVGKHLSVGLDVRFQTTVARIARDDEQWTLFDSDDARLGRFDWLILTAPAPQTRALAVDFPEVVALCEGRAMRACFAMMLGFAKPLEMPWQAALVHDSDISWVSVNSSKPGRKDAFTLVVHSTNAWADEHVDDDIDSVTGHMLKEASLVTGRNLESAAHCEVHRWRYANIDKQIGSPGFVSDDLKLAVCGDWLVRGRIEAAFTSAYDLGWQLQDRV